MKFISKLFIVGLFLGLPLVSVYAQGNQSLVVQSLSPGTTVSPGNEISFSVVPSGFGSSVTYTVSDSLSGSSVTNSIINNGGNVVWIPTASDAGTHTITITATDQGGNSASVQQSIVVKGVPVVTIQSLSPGASVTVGSAVFFTAAATGFTSPVYSVSDIFSGSSLLGSNINSAGGFSWITKANDVGGHSITVLVTDNSGDSASTVQPITVVASASSSIQSVTPGTTISFGQPVTFSIVSTGFTNPVYSVSDSLAGGTISNANINSSGVFTWTPLSQDAGTHNVTITVSDSSGTTMYLHQTLAVQNASLSIQSPTPSGTVIVGRSYSFSVVQNGLINPTYKVTDSFSGSSVSNANMTVSSGFFSWIPIVNDVGTHTIMVVGTDAYGHTANATTIETVAQHTTISTSASVSPVVVPSTYTFNTYLSLGSKGPDVTALQNVLTAKGFYSGPITGTYGPLTKIAVEKFQESHSISPLGVVGVQTRALLNQNTGAGNTTASTTTTPASSRYTFTKSLTLGATGADVTELQKRLTIEGVYTGSITGTYGPLTQAAVKKYQTQHGLSPLGNVGPGTRSVLNGL
jgi:peptidoglycan hydrolase-like protein with peptidoglycan-binding domain